jgi:hypothetical protein
MNDFTKEELSTINEVLERDPWELLTELQIKIQFLIDNYPVHLDVSELETQTK